MTDHDTADRALRTGHGLAARAELAEAHALLQRWRDMEQTWRTTVTTLTAERDAAREALRLARKYVVDAREAIRDDYGDGSRYLALYDESLAVIDAALGQPTEPQP